MRTLKHSPLLEKAASEPDTGAMVEVYVGPDAFRRDEAEAFIRRAFLRHHQAIVRSFAPDLLLLEERMRVFAAAGWRGAGDGQLFLERYLDEPIERVLGGLTGLVLPRERFVEVGHLVADRPGASVQVILSLPRHLSAAGYEWVVFTATEQLVRIFTRLGLPLLALARADPARLGDEARDWGRYYETKPVVVAGRIRNALERIGGRP